MVTVTEQQATAQNPFPFLNMFDLNLTKMVAVLVNGPGMEVPQ